jgi:hypothetical protein
MSMLTVNKATISGKVIKKFGIKASRIFTPKYYAAPFCKNVTGTQI